MVDQREELPLLPFGNPIGAVPAASRGVSLIIKFYFVSFVLFVVIFLSRYNPAFSLCERSVSAVLLSSEQTPSAAHGVCIFSLLFTTLLEGRPFPH